MSRNSLLINGKSVLNDAEFIMLDKDGTLIDCHYYWTAIIARRAEMIVGKFVGFSVSAHEIWTALCCDMGTDFVTGKLKEEGPVGIKPRFFIIQTALGSLAKFGLNELVYDDIASIFLDVDTQMDKDLVPFLKLLPGVESFLNRCNERNIKLAVVSADRTQRIKTTLSLLNIERYFSCVVGGDMVTQNKPSPEPALVAMQFAKQSAFSSAVIGDHAVDVQMGIGSKVACNIGVLTGVGTRKTFAGLECHIISDFLDLGISQ